MMSDRASRVDFMKKVLIILANGFEEVEVVAPINLLRRAGAEVTIATIDSSLKVTGMHGIEIVAEEDFNSAIQRTYDLVILPGGARALAEDKRVIEFVKKTYEAGVYIGAICAATVVLHFAGILKNKKFTSHFSMFEMLPNVNTSTRRVARPLVQSGWVA